MNLYSIRNWNSIYENNRTRELKNMAWVPVPNSHDGDGYTELVSRKNGAALLGAWLVILQVASRCDPRGTLMRRGQKPHTAESLSRITRLPSEVIAEALTVCSSGPQWLDVVDFVITPQDGAGIPQDGAVFPQSGDEEGKGTEQKGIELNEMPAAQIYSPESRIALHWLNEKSGRHFRETESSLAPINARLKEPDVDIAGVKLMIERQCARWKGTPQEEYLRPETLFGKQKFDSYYAAKDLPVVEQKSGKPSHKPDYTKGF